MSSSQLFFFLILFSAIHRTTSVQTCPVSCGATGPESWIRFPFRRDDQAPRCGYPGFELSCNNGSQTILHLPNMGSFLVENINYKSQTILINDPDYCLPKRFTRSFTLSGTPFEPWNPVEFTFYNCSSGNALPTVFGSRVISCMSGGNFTVVAVPTYRYNESGPSTGSCSEINKVVVPAFLPSWSGLEQGAQLKWNVPDFRSCEERGGSCGFKNDKGPDLDIGCTGRPSSGLPTSAKYGIIIGVAIPGLLCFIEIAHYLCSRARDYYYQGRHFDVTTITPQSTVIVTGLKEPTIESYPKTLLGESRLPKPNDNTCSICLCEYQPKEILRTILECNHYFHITCIDEWLRLNATCPVCRNTPEGSAIVTPST
ncbi:hypothetical protein ACOSP7_024696 [Xanthoceras sorbifolium]